MYQDKLWQETEKLIVLFFQEEQGNRITVNNWNSFVRRVKAVFDSNTVKPKEAA